MFAYPPPPYPPLHVPLPPSQGGCHLLPRTRQPLSRRAGRPPQCIRIDNCLERCALCDSCRFQHQRQPHPRTTTPGPASSLCGLQDAPPSRGQDEAQDPDHKQLVPQLRAAGDVEFAQGRESPGPPRDEHNLSTGGLKHRGGAQSRDMPFATVRFSTRAALSSASRSRFLSASQELKNLNTAFDLAVAELKEKEATGQEQY